MAIDIRETFEVAAPIDAVWRFMMDPRRVAACMPGAELDEVVDERTFLGNVKVKVGAITTRYKGRVQLILVDEAAHRIQMVAEGRETSGGTAKGSMSSSLRPLADGGTEVVAEASVDLTGRIMQVGRGMIQGVSHQLFLQFVAAAKQHLEPEAASASAPAAGTGSPSAVRSPSAASKDQQAIRIVPILVQVLWTAIVRFFRRLLGREAAER
jgi:carbon monoxide dehydrogenase subunit G